jgi:hypothetical protein
MRRPAALHAFALIAVAATACGERTGSPAATAGPATVASAPAAAAVAVAAYFDAAELQAETPAQRRAVQQALADLRDRPSAEWPALRYPGLDGTPGQRELAQVLRQHLVAAPQTLDLAAYTAQRDDPAVRAALQRRLEAVAQAIRQSE